jgi:hypothetical protein
VVQVLLEWMDRDGVQVDIDAARSATPSYDIHAVCTAIARARAGWTPLRAAWIGAVIQASRSRGGRSRGDRSRGGRSRGDRSRGGRVLGWCHPAGSIFALTLPW